MIVMGCLFDIQNSILIVIIKSPNEGVRLSLLARKIDFQFLKQTTTKPRGGGLTNGIVVQDSRLKVKVGEQKQMSLLE